MWAHLAVQHGRALSEVLSASRASGETAALVSVLAGLGTSVGRVPSARVGVRPNMKPMKEMENLSACLGERK